MVGSCNEEWEEDRELLNQGKMRLARAYLPRTDTLCGNDNNDGCEEDGTLPIDARASVIVLAAQLEAWRVSSETSEASQRVEAIPGIGVIGATAIVATVADPTIFRSGRDFAAWIELVPRQDSTGGKQKLGPISKQGDRYLRRILVVGAIAVLRRAQENPGKYPWLTQLLARRPFKVVAVALANKMARMAWALLAHGGTYRAPELAETA